MLAVGDSKGVLYLLSLSDTLVESAADDKQLTLQCYERETRREHILETRVKQICLNLKAVQDVVVTSPDKIENEEALLKITEDEYRRVVMAQSLQASVTTQSRGGGGPSMRRR